jgi:Domain of unknown function (DUF4232)
MPLLASRPKRVFGAAGLACVALGVIAALTIEAAAPAAASRAGASGAAASAAPRCKTSALDIWFENEIGGGTAGSVYYRFQFTNLSRHACTLIGYPKVLAVNLAGRRIGSRATDDRSERPRLLRLAPGSSAPALIRIGDAGNFPRSACRPVTVAGFRVYPPGNAASRLVPFPFRVCSKVGNANLSVRVMGSK